MDSKNSIELEEITSIELDANTTTSSQSSSSTATNNGSRTAFAELIRNASQSIQDGDFAGAVRLYTEALKLDSTNHIVYGNRSAAYCRLGKYKKALQDAIKARELKPTWSKAYYRQGIALQYQRDYADALAAFASGLAQDSKSIQLFSGLVETAMKSPLRATLEPIYRQLQVMNSLSPFVITSVVGQELLSSSHFAAAAVVLEAALQIGTSSMKLRGSVLSALSSAYWAMNKLPSHCPDSIGECRAHGNLGSAYFAKCNYKEALTEHRYQLVLAMKNQHTEQAVLALTSLGHVYSAIGDLKNAISSHQQCLQLVRKLGDPLAEAREIGNVGAVHLASGEFEKAIECHLEHVKLAKLLGNKAEEARAYSNLGSAYHYRRHYEQAIQFHEQVLRISQEIGDRTIESKAYAGLGHAARCMNDHIQAKRWYERQLDIALNTKDKAGEARACSNLGIVYQMLGDFDGALKLHWSHLNICKQLNDNAGIGRAYGNIGNAYSALKQSEEAIKYHKLELQISKEVHDRGAEASTHGNLAIAYQSIGLYDQALTHFNLHLSVASEMKDSNSEATALCNLGNYHHLRKDYERAVQYYERYVERATMIGDKENEAKAHHLLGSAYYSLTNYDQALHHFEIDLSLSKEIQDRNSIGRAYCHIGLAKASLGRLDEALECQKYYLCTAQGDTNGKLRAMGNISEVLIRQGKCSEAMRMLEKRLTLARSLGDVNTEANVFASLGSCKKTSNNYEEAARYYKQELIFRQGAQDVMGEITALDNLGECYFKLGNYTLALKCFLDQLDKCEQRKSNMTPAETIGSEYDSDGYYGRRRRSADSFRDYLEACHLSIKAYHNVANTRFRLGQFDEAVNFYDQEVCLLEHIIPMAEKKLLNRTMTTTTTTTTTVEQTLADDESPVDCDQQTLISNKNQKSTQSDQIMTILQALIEKRIQCNRSIGDCHFANTQYEEAIKYYLSFLPASKSLVEQEQVYCLLGKCYQLVNNLTQALVSCEKRLVLAHELGCNRTKAIAYGELGHIHRLLDNYEQAISCFKHEQELSKEPSLRAISDNVDEPNKPATIVQRPIGEVFAGTPVVNVGLVIEAEALHGLGCVAQEMHDYERALKYHSSALAVAQEINSLELESRAYGAIGSAYNALGNYESAVKYQEKYLSVSTIVGDLNAQVSALSALGKIYSSIGQYRQAVKYLEQALLIVENNQSIGQRDQEEARICYELGMALWAVNDLHIAETHLRRSVDLIENMHNNFNSSSNHLTTTTTTTTVAPIHSYSTMLSTSSHYGIVGGGSGSGSDVSSNSSSHYAQFQLANLIQAPSKQQSSHQHLHYQGASYEALTKILIALNRPTDALLIAERSRTRTFLKAKQGFKVLSISSVEQIVEMSRSQNAAILYYSMTIDGSYNSWLITPKGVRFAPLIKSSREKILQLLSSVHNSLLNDGSDSKSFDSNAYNDELDENPPLARSLHHLNRNHLLNSSNYSLSSLFSLSSSVASASTTSSSRHGSFVRYRNRSSNQSIKSRSGSYSNVSMSSSVQMESNVSKMKRSFSNGCVNRNWSSSSALISLYDILIGPFQDQLDEESSLSQLLLVLDGDLFLVPWNMLRNEDDVEFLSERYSLLVMPSLHVLRSDQGMKTLRKSPSHSTISSLVVANPTMPNKLVKSDSCQPQLYYENSASSREASFVSELLSTRPLIGTEANKEAVLSQLSSAQCIHFSSYIIDNTEGDPLKMATGLGIAISPSDVLIGDSAHQLHDHEYLLTPHDLISIGLSAKLVVISCCALSSRSSSHAAALNATTTFNSSQALKTITSALLQAGASCVLLTLWPVPLSALQILFRIFYCSLLQGTRVSAALNEAVSTIQNTSHFSHPRNWAGFLLIGSDVRLSSQVALMSSSLASLLKTPERTRDAMRVVLHLVEKSLQRIQRGQKNAMYTTQQSIENKVGLHTKGWRELLMSVGFRFEPSSTNGLPACVFFPQSDPNGRLIRCSTALQAILALTPATINSISKLVCSAEFVAEIIEQLSKVVQHNSDYFNGNELSSASLFSSHLEVIHLKLWSTPGCHELYASLGFDLMEVGSDSVTLRAGKNANMRTILFALQTLQALYDKDNMENESELTDVQHQHQSDEPIYQKSGSLCTEMFDNSNQTPMLDQFNQFISDESKSNEKELDRNEFSLYQNRGEPDGQHKSASLNSSRSNSSTSSISGLPCSRSTIGRSLLDSEMIEQKLKQMSIQSCDEQTNLVNESVDCNNFIANLRKPLRPNICQSNGDQSNFNNLDMMTTPRNIQYQPIAMDRQSISSTSSIATANTVLNRQIGSNRTIHRRNQFSFDSTTSSNQSQPQYLKSTYLLNDGSLSSHHAIKNSA
ncbi:Tetratricopeptide repeat protein 28 [Blomia tropicalis]|nr:Tetratricopeptide repeat protein 28 [Blomia tropicalis]